jgi:HprK-related kinase A
MPAMPEASAKAGAAAGAAGASAAAAPTAAPPLGAMALGALRTALRGPGLCLDLGAATLRVRSDSAALAAGLQAVYREHPLATALPWVDIDLRIARARGARRWLRPLVHLRGEAAHPFEPFPADTALPLFEWGANWMLGLRLHDHLLLHAGALERNGRALLLPAMPGAGKSTLTAALSLRGWRLLSDEFGAWDWRQGHFTALLKPVALKNESIAVIRRFAPDAPLGPVFEKTRKGTVAHLAADAPAVHRRHAPALPGAFVLPQWQAGAALRLEPVDAHALFGALAFNAFNYRVLGATGYDAVVRLVHAARGWRLVYGALDDALAALDALWRREVTAAPGGA